eukprot:CFRG6936T1
MKLDNMEEAEERARRIKVVLLCVAWYGFSAITNNLSKQILKEFPYPQTMTTCQLGSVLLLQPLFMRFLKIKYQTLSPRNFLCKLLPLSLVRVVAMILGTFSILLIPISYAHTVKAISPVCTVIMAAIILNEWPTTAIVVSLVPIVLGICIATMTEVHFDLTGMLCALLSTLIFSWQNIYNKKLMRLHILDHMNLLYHSTRASLLLIIPFWLFTDGIQIMNNNDIWSQSEDFSWPRICVLLMLDGITYYGQNISAFSVLFLVSPVSYSVANTTKRIVIITTSLFVFQNEVSIYNIMGMTLAIVGVGLYNRAKFEVAKQKKGFQIPQTVLDECTTLETPFMEFGDKAVLEAADSRLSLTPRSSIVQHVRDDDRNGHVKNSRLWSEGPHNMNENALQSVMENGKNNTMYWGMGGSAHTHSNAQSFAQQNLQQYLANMHQDEHMLQYKPKHQTINSSTQPYTSENGSNLVLKAPTPNVTNFTHVQSANHYGLGASSTGEDNHGGAQYKKHPKSSRTVSMSETREKVDSTLEWLGQYALNKSPATNHDHNN